MAVGLLILLFILVPIAEIYVIIQVGQAIGALWTILLLIADSVIGARLLAWQGRSAWGRFQEALAAGRVPHREILDGVMVVAGGTLLLTPGFITDVVGLILLLPPSRALVRHGRPCACITPTTPARRCCCTWRPASTAVESCQPAPGDSSSNVSPSGGSGFRMAPNSMTRIASSLGVR